MNPRLILLGNNVLSRKWAMATDILAKSMYSTFYLSKERKFNYYLHKNWDLSYSQCKLFHQTNYLYKKRKTKEEKKMVKDFTPPRSKHKEKEVIEVWKDMTVRELANSMEMPLDDLLEVMEFVPNTHTYTKGSSVIDNFGTLQLIIKQLGCRWIIVSRNKESEIEVSKDAVKQPPPDPNILVKRYPVVTIMGHVDHGKTTLLDSLRNTSVVDKEFGGITQHIGAFSVQLKDDRKITFLDTPGHAAFTSMRSRGASVTDIVVLVVAADDGVMEQTDESIRMARNAQVPIIVAINKIDKPQADIERTKRMLLQRGIQLEDSGGDVQFVPISALKGTNLNELVEAILVQAEVMELKGDPVGNCEGVVIESKHDPQRGKLATVIVQRGTLKKGKLIVAGLGWAKVRAMLDDRQKEVISAEPSIPVEIMGWKELPSAGDIVLEVESDKRAREVIDWREKQRMLEKSEQDIVAIKMKAEEHEKEYKSMLALKRKMGRYRLKPTGPREKEIKDEDVGPMLSILIKGDVDGSVEAIIDILATYRSSLCKLDIVHFDIGSVTLNDIELADSFNAVIYAFNVDVLPEAKQLALQKSTVVRHHNVIYKLIDDLKSDINNQLPPVEEDEILGEANVLQQFTVTEGRKKVPVAGSKCIKGTLKKSARFRLIRNGEIIHEGSLQSMRHLKDEVDSIKQDLECGLRLTDTSISFEPGDTLVCYVVNKRTQVTDWDPGF